MRQIGDEPAAAQLGAGDPAGPRVSLSPVLVFVCFEWLGFGIALPVLPFYAEALGASPFEVTAVVSTYAVVQLFAAIVLGPLSDRWGRKRVLLLCMACSAIGQLGSALAHSLPELFAARALAGVAGAAFPVATAYVADGVEESHRAQSMGWLTACWGLAALCAGPAVGALLTGVLGAPLETAFLLATATSAVGFLVAALGLGGGVRSPRVADPAGSRGQGLRILLRPVAVQAIVLAFAVEFCVAGLIATLPLWVERRFAWSSGETGFLLLYMGALMCICHAVLVGPLVKRFGEPKVILHGLVLFMLGFLLVEIVFRWELLVLCGLFICAGVGVLVPALFSFASAHTPEGWQGTVLGTLEAATSLAYVAGPLFAGFLFESASMDWPSRACALILLALVVAVAGRAPETRESPAQAA